MKDMKAKESLQDCTIPEIKAFIDSELRTRSKKTNKLIKINTFKWSKSDLVLFIESHKLEKQLISYLNGWYYDLPGYTYNR